METTTAATAAVDDVNDVVEGEVEIILGSDDWTGITAERARTAIRGGGIGARAYVAKLSAPGADSRFEFEREFMDADRSDVSRSGRSGGITWELDGEASTNLLASPPHLATQSLATSASFLAGWSTRLVNVRSRNCSASEHNRKSRWSR